MKVDEIIFRTTKIRNRLILELMSRGGMRIGEVLKLTHNGPAVIGDFGWPNFFIAFLFGVAGTFSFTLMGEDFT